MKTSKTFKADRTLAWRVGFYLFGLLSLAIGLSLATQVDLGVSPIISVAFAASCLTGLNFGDATFILYVAFVCVEIVIHIYQKRYRSIPMDILQIILSLVFTRFLNLFKAIIPHFTNDLAGTWMGSIPGKILFLLLSIVFTGIGAALSMDMRIVPNPGDGIVQAIADLVGKKPGFIKNCVDITCVCVSCILGLVCAHTIYGVSIGTICAMILTGRCIALINKCALQQMLSLAGMTKS